MLRLSLITMAAAMTLTSAHAYEYAHTQCTTAVGDRIEAVVKDGKAIIRHNSGKWHPAFTRRDGDIGILTQIGDYGKMVLATSLKGKRSYVITDFDDGRPRFEAKAWCTHTAK